MHGIVADFICAATWQCTRTSTGYRVARFQAGITVDEDTNPARLLAHNGERAEAQEGSLPVADWHAG